MDSIGVCGNCGYAECQRCGGQGKADGRVLNVQHSELCDYSGDWRGVECNPCRAQRVSEHKETVDTICGIIADECDGAPELYRNAAKRIIKRYVIGFAGIE